MIRAIEIGPGENPELRAFLATQLEWERWHLSRVRLVHALAAGGMCLWVLQAAGGILPPAVHLAVLAAWVWMIATGVVLLRAAVRKRPPGEGV